MSSCRFLSQQRCAALAPCAAAAAAVPVAWWLALKLRIVPRSLCKINFTASVLGSVVATACTTFFVDLFRKVGLVSHEKTGDLCAYLAASFFRLAFILNPQIRVIFDESEVKRSSLPPRTCLLCNHTSFLDALMVVSFSPAPFITTARTLMKAGLQKLPLLGPCFDRVGHFPVYFKSDESGVFSVDKDRQAAVSEKVVKHVKRGGSLTICPEGQMNKNPAELLPFRNGSFQTILDNNMEVFYYAFWGIGNVWPLGAPLPSGGPDDIYVHVGRIGPALEGEDCAALSARCQGVMQKAVTELKNKAEEAKKQK